jgi:hypothetical protein
MAQRKPERTLIDEIIRLVYPLTPEEHDELVQQMKRQWAEGAANNQLRFSRAESQKALNLAGQLTPKEQAELLDELKLVWLRRALDEGEESLRQHGGIPAEEVFDRLQAKYERMKAEKQ